MQIKDNFEAEPPKQTAWRQYYMALYEILVLHYIKRCDITYVVLLWLIYDTSIISTVSLYTSNVIYITNKIYLYISVCVYV